MPAERSMKFHFKLPFEDAKQFYCICNSFQMKVLDVSKSQSDTFNFKSIFWGLQKLQNIVKTTQYMYLTRLFICGFDNIFPLSTLIQTGKF